MSSLRFPRHFERPNDICGISRCGTSQTISPGRAERINLATEDSLIERSRCLQAVNTELSVVKAIAASPRRSILYRPTSSAAMCLRVGSGEPPLPMMSIFLSSRSASAKPQADQFNFFAVKAGVKTCCRPANVAPTSPAMENVTRLLRLFVPTFASSREASLYGDGPARQQAPTIIGQRTPVQSYVETPSTNDIFSNAIQY